MENTCMSLTLIGYGTTSVNSLNANIKDITYNDNTTSRKTITKVKAENTFYGLASKAVVLGAITILKDHINISKGGVLTPAAAFHNTQFVNRLVNHDVVVLKLSDLITYGQQ